MSFSTVCRWVAKFKSGLQQLKDAGRPGRPATKTKRNIQKINDFLKKDSRYTLKDLARFTNMSLSQVHNILKKHLKLKKINARWIPHLLTDEQKRTRVAVAKKLLRMYPEFSKKVFDSLVTCDETWVYFYEPKRKCSNKVWATRNARRPNIAKRTRTVKKIMYVIFFNSKGPVLQIPVPKGKTVTENFYRNVVLKH